MEYHQDEADRFHPEPKPKDHPSVWMLAAILIGWFLAMAYAGKTDLEDAINVVQAEEQAYDKKIALLSMPCPWIAVCIHEPCSVLHRRCASSADLTERK